MLKTVYSTGSETEAQNITFTHENFLIFNTSFASITKSMNAFGLVLKDSDFIDLQ